MMGQMAQKREQMQKQAVGTKTELVEEVAVKATTTEPVDTSATDEMLDKIEAALEDADTTGPIESGVADREDIGSVEELFDLGMEAALEFLGFILPEEDELDLTCDTCPCGISMALCHRNTGTGIRPFRFGGMNIVLIN